MISGDDETYYPLYAASLGDDERELLVQIILAGMRAGVARRVALNDRLKFELRHVVGTRKQEIDKRFSGARNRAEAPFWKWAAVYNYVMDDFRKKCVADGRAEIIAMIDKLHALGIQSERYKRDMHWFNLRNVNYNSMAGGIDSKYVGDPYVGFRYTSDQKNFVIFVVTINHIDDRYIFTSTVMRGSTNRNTSGFVYPVGLNSAICLSGLLRGGQGGEFYSLVPEGDLFDRLFGIVTTVSKENIPHAKQCLLIRMGRLIDTTQIKPEHLAFQTGKAAFLTAIDNCFDPETGRIRFLSGEVENLDRYVVDDVVTARNMGEYYAGTEEAQRRVVLAARIPRPDPEPLELKKPRRHKSRGT